MEIILKGDHPQHTSDYPLKQQQRTSCKASLYIISLIKAADPKYKSKLTQFAYANPHPSPCTMLNDIVYLGFDKHSSRYPILYLPDVLR